MTRREFRSDTMTLPTQAMRDAMSTAELGDDVCIEDPTVEKLQKLAAKKLGKEDALFVPSGVFGNQCAIGLHARPGDEVILPEDSHVIEHETGAMGALWGVQARQITHPDTAYPTAQDIEPRIRSVKNIHFPDTGLIVIENALSNGTVMPVEEMQKIKTLASKHDIPVHLDGARIFNAASALDVDVKDIAQQADTVTFCLSKGLGAPVGSLLCGTSEFIKRARIRRKMMGGGMRQVGVLAAPGIIALTNPDLQIKKDHSNAKLLAKLLADIPCIQIDTADVQVNMVFFHVTSEKHTEEELVQHLNSSGFDTFPPAAYGLRLVTSSRVEEKDVRDVAACVAGYLAS